MGKETRKALTRTISLPAHLDKAIQEVTACTYRSRSDVVKEGIELFLERFYSQTRSEQQARVGRTEGK